MSNLAVSERGVERSGRDLGALVFYSQFDDPKEWSDALKRFLPDLDAAALVEPMLPERLRQSGTGDHTSKTY